MRFTRGVKSLADQIHERLRMEFIIGTLELDERIVELDISNYFEPLTDLAETHYPIINRQKNKQVWLHASSKNM